MSGPRLRARSQGVGAALGLGLEESAAIVEAIHADLVAGQRGLVERTDALIAARLPDRLAARAADVRRILAATPAAGTSLYGGAGELLSGIRDLGLRCVLVSNAALHPRVEYLARLGELGLAAHLDGLVSSYDMGLRKPHRAMFEAGLGLAGCGPEAAVMIGDSEEKDIRPAAALGMRTIQVCIQTPPGGVGTADSRAGSLREVLDIVRLLAAGQVHLTLDG